MKEPYHYTRHASTAVQELHLSGVVRFNVRCRFQVAFVLSRRLILGVTLIHLCTGLPMASSGFTLRRPLLLPCSYGEEYRSEYMITALLHVFRRVGYTRYGCCCRVPQRSSPSGPRRAGRSQQLINNRAMHCISGGEEKRKLTSVEWFELELSASPAFCEVDLAP